jgi:hypothetical protein
MIEKMRVQAPELVHGAVDLRPIADVACTGTDAAGRGAGARRSFEEGPPRAPGSA